MEKEPLLTQVWEIYTTIATEEAAHAIARGLLDSRLAACVQVNGPVRSFYRWQGAIHDDLEWKITIKTSQEQLESCWSELRRIHPYELPELLARPASKVSEEYAQWVRVETTIKPVPDAMRRAWHLRVAGRPMNAISGERVMVLGKMVDTLLLPTGPIPMKARFEDVAERFSRMPNLHFEPDGAFTWGSVERRSKDERVWQLDGMIYDREDRIEYVELKGNCDRVTWQAFTQVLSGVEYGPLAYSPLVVQWMEQGIWLSEPNFNLCIE